MEPQTLQEQGRLFPPPTPGEQQAIDIFAGLTVAFTVWFLLGAPGLGD